MGQLQHTRVNQLTCKSSILGRVTESQMCMVHARIQAILVIANTYTMKTCVPFTSAPGGMEAAASLVSYRAWRQEPTKQVCPRGSPGPGCLCAASQLTPLLQHLDCLCL